MRSSPLLLALTLTVLPIATAAGAAGALRISGSPADGPLINRLWAGYLASHPNARLETRLKGPESTLAGIYTGTADIALMARETREPMERMAFQWAMLAAPFEVTVATAGVEADRPSAQLAIFVNRANPVTRLTLPQLDALLSAERLRGGTPIVRWGDADVDGDFSAQPVHVYGPPVDTTDALYMRRLVMKDSRKWRADYHTQADAAAVVKAIGADRDGVGFAPLGLGDTQVRAVALVDDKGQAWPADRGSIANRDYPLVRSIRMIVYRPDKGQVASETQDFLRYVLSPAGQALIAVDGHYFPLPPNQAAAERARLD